MNFLKVFFTGFKCGFSAFGHNLTALINSFLLLVVYIFGVGLTALVAKLMGKHFINIRKGKNQDSYWAPLNLQKKPVDDYYRQF